MTTNLLPNRFDIIKAQFDIKLPTEKQSKDVIGYVVDVRDEPTKSNSVNPNNGMPPYTPKQYTIRFINEGLKEFPEEIFKSFISSCKKWEVIKQNKTIDTETPKYG